MNRVNTALAAVEARTAPCVCAVATTAAAAPFTMLFTAVVCTVPHF